MNHNAPRHRNWLRCLVYRLLGSKHSRNTAQRLCVHQINPSTKVFPDECCQLLGLILTGGIGSLAGFVVAVKAYRDHMVFIFQHGYNILKLALGHKIAWQAHNCRIANGTKFIKLHSRFSPVFLNCHDNTATSIQHQYLKSMKTSFSYHPIIAEGTCTL